MKTRSIPFDKGWTVNVAPMWGEWVDIDVRNSGSGKPPIGDASPSEALALARALILAALTVRLSCARSWLGDVAHRLPRTRIYYTRAAGLDPSRREWLVAVGESVQGRFPRLRPALVEAARSALSTYTFHRIWR